jgi:hypothetical protein
MTPQKRTDVVFDKAKKLSLENPITNEGAPTREMVAEAINNAEGDAESCREAFVTKLNSRIEYHRGANTGNARELDESTMLALINVRDAYTEAFLEQSK